MFGSAPTRRCLVLALAAWMAIASPVLLAGKASATPRASPSYYVALGDSRASVANWTAIFSDGCARGPDSYPLLAAAQLGVSVTTRVCGGATTANVTTVPQLTLFGFQPPQADALSPQTQLVTLSIGGNDIDWWSLISACFTPLFGADAGCRTNASVASRIDAALAGLAPTLDSTLQVVQSRAPSARLFVVGHGGYYGLKGCQGQANMSDGDAIFVSRFFTRFNEVLRASAQRAQSTYVDIAGPAVGHDSCASDGQRWFQGNSFSTEGQSRHPTSLGRRAMADLVVAAVRN